MRYKVNVRGSIHIDDSIVVDADGVDEAMQKAYNEVVIDCVDNSLIYDIEEET